MKKFAVYLPNSITVLRCILTVPFIGMLAAAFIHGPAVAPAGAYILFALICATDLLDGATARALKAESAQGAVLDIAADCLFVFSSLVLFNILDVIPVWFTGVALADFLVFLTTSKVFLRLKREAQPFVFDAVGRGLAVLIYLLPAAACWAWSHPGFELAFNALLFAIAVLVCIAVTNRCIRCFAAAGHARQM